MSPQESIAHYRITGKLGEGGMGAVYRATDTRLNREVAIKVLPDSFAADPQRAARFAREAQVLASLSHPNIAAIHGVEELALVMELVEGEDLRGPLPPDEALPIVQQLIEALEYAHEKGIVHRDLKPANIRLTPNGKVKVLDFGLAKAMSGGAANVSDPENSPTLTFHMTGAGMIVGTAAYMSPEQARGKVVDKRADIWAFGVVVYELLTGRQLFEGDNVSDILAQVLTRPVELDAVPAPFRPLLQRCLERDPRKRLRDIGDAPALLEAPQPEVVADRRRPWGWMAACCLLAVLASVFGWIAMRNVPTQPRAHHYTVDEKGLFVSPDGRWIGHKLLSRKGIRVRATDSPSWRVLAGTEGAIAPFWAADSSAIGYFADGQLYTVQISGRTIPRRWASAPDPRGGAWRGGLSDGTILYVAGNALHAIDLSSSKITDLPIQFDTADAPSNPVFLPEGDGFVYNAGSPASLFRSSLSSAAPRGELLLTTRSQVAFAQQPRTGQWHIFYADDSGTLMTHAVSPRDGVQRGPDMELGQAVGMFNELAGRKADFSVGAGGVLTWGQLTSSMPVWRLRWYDKSGKVVGALGEPGTFWSVALSPDETKLAVAQGFPDFRIWIYVVRTGTGTQFSTLPGRHTGPLWSPDGSAVYYAQGTGTGARIVRQNLVAGSIAEVLYEDRNLGLQSMTPDGRELLLTRNTRAADAGVYRLKVDGAAPRKLERVEGYPGTNYLRLSPDGHSLVTKSFAVLTITAYPGAETPPRPVATCPGEWVLFSGDGKTVHSIDQEGLASYSVLPVAGGGFRVGEPFRRMTIRFPNSGGPNSFAAEMRDGRIIAISTDPGQDLGMHIVTDWTILLNESNP